MNSQVAILGSLAMDLKRVSLGLQRGSLTMAQRFANEALERKREINRKMVDPYIVRLLTEMEKKIKNLKSERVAEDTLMYSVLFQNYAQKKRI